MTAPTWVSDCGRVTLYHGEALAVLASLPNGSVDAVVTDPPYGMGWDTDSRRFTMGGRPWATDETGGDFIVGDADPFDPSPWLAFPRVVLWGANHYAQRLPIGTTLVWLKRHDHLFGTFLSDAEIGWMNSGHGVYCHREPFGGFERARQVNARRAAHPTQKPIGLMRWCMERAKVATDAVVMDGYMGSGTTGVACVQTGRRFIGIEIVADHFETAKRRIQAALAQPGLFELTGPREEQLPLPVEVTP